MLLLDCTRAGHVDMGAVRVGVEAMALLPSSATRARSGASFIIQPFFSRDAGTRRWYVCYYSIDALAKKHWMEAGCC